MKIVSNFGFTIRHIHKEGDDEQYPELELVIRSPNKTGDISGELVIKRVGNFTIRTRESILDVINTDGDIDIFPACIADGQCLIYDSEDDSINDGYFEITSLKGEKNESDHCVNPPKMGASNSAK